VFALIKFFASIEKQDEIANKYKSWGYGYGHAKLELLEILLEYFKEAREKYKYYENNFSIIEEKLKLWNKKVDSIATEKYKKMMEVVGL
jgi:tryptophanyl-tRNA synthetase